MNGIVTNGWAYVWAAYGFTALVLVAYISTVLQRARAKE